MNRNRLIITCTDRFIQAHYKYSVNKGNTVKD